MKITCNIVIEVNSDQPSFTHQNPVLSITTKETPDRSSFEFQAPNPVERKSNLGHGRGGHSTEERVALLRGALNAFARQNPKVGGLEGRAGEFPPMLAEYGYKNSGAVWYGKDFRYLAKLDHGFECVHYQKSSKDMYRIQWAADKETVSLNNTGRLTLRVGSGEAR